MLSPAKFAREVRQEMSKVTWPTRKETRASTVMVLILVMVSALFFWLVDNCISWLVGIILGFRA
jgi:preprotein translocase subunit SecE